MSGKCRFIAGIRNNPVRVKAGILAAVSVVCFAVLYRMDNSRRLDTDAEGRAVIQRGESGVNKTQKLRVKSEDLETDIEIPISGKEYTDEELDTAFKNAGKYLQNRVLGENTDPDNIRKPLNLITEIPETGLGVSWEMDRYDVIDLQGNIIAGNLTEKGEKVLLKAILSYGDRKEQYEFRIMVFPPAVSSEKQLIEEIMKEAGKADETGKTDSYVVLPDQAAGRALQWKYGTEKRAYGILVLGTGAACMLLVSERQKKKEKEKRELRQMQMDYPRIINKFNLYVRAGMTVRRAWFLIVQDYERKNGGIKDRKAYEEMAVVMYRIRGGMPEGECYEEFGIRCREPAYRRFGMLLSQNLRKGPKGLTDILEREAAEAFEDRKKLAKKLGEEAGTKLMIPMFMMLIIVFAIVTVPAFFSIQI